MAFLFWRRPRLDGPLIADRNELIVDRPLPPFKPDSDFIPPRGGSAVVPILKRAKSKSGYRVALVGPAGVGKSQLAIEHCCQANEVFRLPLVFWIGAETRERFLGDVRSIAELLHITDHGTTDLERVAQWLLDPSSGPWFLVLDGVSSADVLSCSDGDPNTPGDDSGAQRRDFVHLLSNVSHGSILVTTRDKDTAMALGIRSSDIVPVRAMRAGAAAKLLLKKLGDQNQQSKQDYMELVKTLEYNPLAILQAAAYIRRRPQPISVNAYEQELKRKKTSLGAFFQEGSYQFRRDCSASDYIKACWRPVVEFLEPSRKATTPAASLLCFMSFFDRDHIPKLLAESQRGGADESAVPESSQGHQSHLQTIEPSPLGDGDNQRSTDAPEGAVQDLLDAGFIAEGDPGVFSMHQLVQLAVARHRLTDAELLRKQAQVLCYASLYQLEMGYPDQAMEFANQSLKAMKMHKPEDYLVLESKHYLGRALRNLGHYEAADDTFSEVLKTCSAHLGPDDPMLLSIREDHAMNLESLGRLDEAVMRIDQVRADRNKYGGPANAHPADIIGCDANQATLLRLRNDLEGAEQLYLSILQQARESSLDQNHPDILAIKCELATVYRDQGKFQAAEGEFSKLLSVCTITLGRNHSLTLNCKANLVTTYLHLKECAKAEELGVEVAQLRQSRLGKSHADTLRRHVGRCKKITGLCDGNVQAEL
ncbi:P-loop containing nucleoside triphosphate hydrolase protein [Microdochium trichocladiopsis]|uniref:P-loop containing nucleoside triphosphate hydrolase protein n=1 Tax=Microdochium trichocladiopsis TaxID=1682393 RepID=A0A9P8XR21_9PEZI|nr:P-loop containing nucleoside triphosphate hydrolase protein [Microdochium trichocladiopsis]KAH7012236.1 P-loop containing nucleoside triphosphate hydrolase protein [Microdochium trichocladiopsis]